MLSAERKIAGSHLERLAMVYLRQSSPAQVRLNTRSTERQYGLADEAARLGWERDRIAPLPRLASRDWDKAHDQHREARLLRQGLDLQDALQRAASYENHVPGPRIRNARPRLLNMACR